MALKSIETKRSSKPALPKIEADVYAPIPTRDLIIFAVQFLHERGSEVTTEDVVIACFRLFPHKFALKKYARWPDSAMVSRRWSECRALGLITGDAAAGFNLTAKGIRLAERVRKKLGIVKPVERTKAVKPARKAGAAGAVKAKAKISQTKKAEKKPVEKRVKVEGKKKVSAPKLKAAPVRKIRRKPAAIKRAGEKGIVPAAKPQVRQEAKSAPPMAAAGKHPPAPIKTARTIHPIKKGGAPVSPAPQPMTAITPPSQPVDRVRAGKFVRMMETSDAYLHYRRNGSQAKISEFDFRSMLLCTLESSPETLARNVTLFKGYAGVHNRHDLIAFLEFCEEKFASILMPASRQPVKRRSG